LPFGTGVGADGPWSGEDSWTNRGYRLLAARCQRSTTDVPSSTAVRAVGRAASIAPASGGGAAVGERAGAVALPEERDPLGAWPPRNACWIPSPAAMPRTATTRETARARRDRRDLGSPAGRGSSHGGEGRAARPGAAPDGPRSVPSSRSRAA